MTGPWQERARAAAAVALDRPSGAVVVSPLALRPGREVYLCTTADRRVVAKCYPDFARARAAHQALELLGGRHGGLLVPRALAFDSACFVVVQTELVGRPLAPLLGGDDGLRHAGRAATAIAALHALPVELQRALSRDDALRGARGAVGALCGDDARIVDDALRVAEVELQSAASLGAVPSHGDLGAAQLLDCGDAVGLLDFDKAAQAEPALDVGNLAAQLVRAQGAPGLALVARLTEGYEHASGRTLGRLVSAYAALVLARKLAFLESSARDPVRRALLAVLAASS
jgi:hypothetical protein